MRRPSPTDHGIDSIFATVAALLVAIASVAARSADLDTRRTTLAGETEPLAVPTGLEPRVYSRTAAELLRTRPPDFGLVCDVSRDGVSFFDDTLGPRSRSRRDRTLPYLESVDSSFTSEAARIPQRRCLSSTV